MALTGVLAGPISGLKYQTPTFRGLTNERGEFRYEDGERIAFLLGGNAIGNVTAGPRLHLAQIVARDNGTDIPPEAHQIIGDRRINFRHDADYSATAMADKVLQFTEVPVVGQLLEDLDGAGIFATPRGCAQPPTLGTNSAATRWGFFASET